MRRIEWLAQERCLGLQGTLVHLGSNVSDLLDNGMATRRRLDIGHTGFAEVLSVAEGLGSAHL